MNVMHMNVLLVNVFPVDYFRSWSMPSDTTARCKVMVGVVLNRLVVVVGEVLLKIMRMMGWPVTMFSMEWIVLHVK